MNHWLGTVITSPLMPGLEGTVVNVNVTSGMWRRAAPTYDVLWSDMHCTRRLSQDSLESGEGGQFVVLDRRKDPTECARLWYSYQIYRVSELAARATAHSAAAAPVDSGHVSDRPKRAGSPDLPALTGAPARPTGREVATLARQSLARQIPGVGFAVTCSRQHLDVSWVDGPVEGYAWRVLAELREQGLVNDLRMRRSLSTDLIQRAIDYSLDRVFGGEPSEYARLRVTPDQYANGSLNGLMCDEGACTSSMSYQVLVKCVLARWDDSRHRFVNTAQTRGLLHEMALLFPRGDEEATHRFLDLSQEVGERESVARQLVERVQRG